MEEETCYAKRAADDGGDLKQPLPTTRTAACDRAALFLLRVFTVYYD